jgi:anhydro-N-acetylmuramic acid kinase
MDVALDGQGAPLMGIADILLFNQYKINLNLGGICNISVNGVEKIAFDICPCNQLYNYIYNNIGIAYDDKGELAKTGSLHLELLNSLNAHPYYSLPYPKSLDNNLIFRQILPKLDIALADIDKLHTITEFVTSHITMCIETLLVKKVISQGDKLLITGGGTHNLYLVQQLKKKLMKYNITCAETSDDIINYKEIVLMALLAFLKKYDKVNVLSNFTGALKDTKSGGVYG